MYQHAAGLRVLLVYNELSRAWGKVWPAGDRPRLTVLAPDLQSLVPEPMLPQVVFGGAHLTWSDIDSKYRDLTDSGRWMRIRGRSPAVFELLSIGQIVVRSESVRLFRERVRQLRLEPLL